MDYRAMAERALNKREDIFEKRKSAAAAGKRDLVREYDRQMDDLATEAREYVEFAERQGEIREAFKGAGALGAATPGEVRADGGDEFRGGLLPSEADMETRAVNGSEFLIPSGTAAKYVDILRAKAVFLRGIPAENLLPFGERTWEMPVLNDTDMPGLVQANALIVEGDDTWAGLSFTAKKYADLRGAANETFADASVNLRNVLAQTLLRNVAVQFDADAFTGAGGTTDPVLGLVGQGNSVAASGATGETATWDDVSDAVLRIWQGNAEPTVIWAAPDAANALAKEREGTEGGYLEPDTPLNVARRLPTLVSTNIPAGNVIVAAGDRVFAGVREDAKVAVSEHAEFANDRTLVRLTMRAAGTYVAETSSVQVITAAP